MHCTRLATQQASSSSMAPVSRVGPAPVAGPTAYIPVRPRQLRARQLSADGGALCRRATLATRAIPGRLGAQPTVAAAGVEVCGGGEGAGRGLRGRGRPGAGIRARAHMRLRAGAAPAAPAASQRLCTH